MKRYDALIEETCSAYQNYLSLMDVLLGSFTQNRNSDYYQVLMDLERSHLKAIQNCEKCLSTWFQDLLKTNYALNIPENPRLTELRSRLTSKIKKAMQCCRLEQDSIRQLQSKSLKPFPGLRVKKETPPAQLDITL